MIPKCDFRLMRDGLDEKDQEKRKTPMSEETGNAMMRRDADVRREEAEAAPVNPEGDGGAVVETPEEEEHRYKVAAMVLEAVAPLLEVEIKGNLAESEAQWLAWKKSVRPLNSRVIRRVRTVALEHKYPGREWLAHVLNTALAIQTRKGVSMEARAITAAIVNEAWQGIDGWQR